MEHWIEINLQAEVPVQNGILLDVLRPYAEGLEKSGTLVSFHFFREPEIRFRIRMRTPEEKEEQKHVLSAIAERLVEGKVVSEWHFGSHGEEGREYTGEEDRYGKNGWKVAQEYFRNGSEIAFHLLALKRTASLENPLWAEGLGNPWEGGDRNPWREKERDPLAFHWSRFVHLFTNQVGFDMETEANLCEKQAKHYREVVRQFGIRW